MSGLIVLTPLSKDARLAGVLRISQKIPAYPPRTKPRSTPCETVPPLVKCFLRERTSASLSTLSQGNVSRYRPPLDASTAYTCLASGKTTIDPREGRSRSEQSFSHVQGESLESHSCQDFLITSTLSSETYRCLEKPAVAYRLA